MDVIESHTSASVRNRESFESVIKDPDAWLRQASQMLMAVEILTTGFVGLIERTRSMDDLDRKTGSFKLSLLALGYCCENAMKALMAKQGIIMVSEGKIDPASFGKKSGHNLVNLAKLANFKLTTEEHSLFLQLTEVIRWAGKYQAPLTTEELIKSKTNNPLTISIPGDVAAIRAIYDRVYSQIHTKINRNLEPP